MTQGRHTAVIVRDEDGHCSSAPRPARVPHPGPHTLAARDRMRDALSLFVDDADTAQSVGDLRLPGDAPSQIGGGRQVISGHHAAPP
ncbi:MAG: hypothetical protein ACRD0K_23835 [Egibacteraceae bacterium]